MPFDFHLSVFTNSARRFFNSRHRPAFIRMRYYGLLVVGVVAKIGLFRGEAGLTCSCPLPVEPLPALSPGLPSSRHGSRLERLPDSCIASVFCSLFFLRLLAHGAPLFAIIVPWTRFPFPGLSCHRPPFLALLSFCCCFTSSSCCTKCDSLQLDLFRRASALSWQHQSGRAICQA